MADWRIYNYDHHIPGMKRGFREQAVHCRRLLLLLEQQGKLPINDDIHKYTFPELPDYGTDTSSPGDAAYQRFP